MERHERDPGRGGQHNAEIGETIGRERPPPCGQLMLHGGKNLLRCQSLEVLAGVVMPDPDQKAPSAQKDAFAGLGLKTPHPAQIIGKGGQERGVWIIDYKGYGNNEPFGRHSPRVLKC